MSGNMNSYREVANILHQARLDRQPIIAPTSFDQLSLEDGYLVQKQLIAIKRKHGNSITGWKVAMANQPALDRFQIDEPVYGVLFSDMLIEGGSLSSAKVIAPKLEAELAFTIGRNLQGQEFSDEEIIEAIAYVSPVFEVADSRIQGWKFNISSFIADNAVASYYQLGEKQVLNSALSEINVQCTLSFSSEKLVGVADNVLDGPLSSFIKMVRKVLVMHGRIESGQHFISGSLTKPIDMTAGQTYTLEMLGTRLILNYK